ncbi:MAG: hypothetical protein QOC82_1958 [Frankiaceae bacterium]|jgi:hypothetical protein|nr:hypothetical protein [Frankiaceae bacterium]
MAAFRLRQARASDRQEAIQLYCCDELRARGLRAAEIEVPIAGAYRTKRWDVGMVIDSEPRLAISCKSIIANHGGTVPNRVDDMLGEAVNLHRRWPRAVIGYLFMMARVDESLASTRRRQHLRARGYPEDVILEEARESGGRWFARLGESVSQASGRESEADLPEMFEAVSCSLVGFEVSPLFPVEYHPSTPRPAEFFDILAETYTERFGRK